MIGPLGAKSRPLDKSTSAWRQKVWNSFLLAIPSDTTSSDEILTPGKSNYTFEFSYIIMDDLFKASIINYFNYLLNGITW